MLQIRSRRSNFRRAMINCILSGRSSLMRSKPRPKSGSREKFMKTILEAKPCKKSEMEPLAIWIKVCRKWVLLRRVLEIFSMCSDSNIRGPRIRAFLEVCSKCTSKPCQVLLKHCNLDWNNKIMMTFLLNSTAWTMQLEIDKDLLRAWDQRRKR